MSVSGGYGETDQSKVTRRKALAGAGGAAAGGLLVVGLPDSPEAARRTHEVAAGATDRHTVGYIAQINQVGPSMTAFGYLTRVRGLSLAALFTSPPGRNSIDPRSADSTAARFTLFAEAIIQSLSTVADVITVVATGQVRFFHQPAGGARFDDTDSFRKGTEVAAFDATFQNNLAVDAPDRAGVALSGELTQRRAGRFANGNRRVRFGRKALPWSMYATGRGERTERTTPRSQIFLTGSLGVVDARRHP